MKDMMRLSRNPDFFWDWIDNEVVACCISTGEFFRFNKTGHLIWQMCDDCTPEALVARILSLFPDNDPDALGTETRTFIESLLNLKLLTASAAENHEKANLSNVGTD
jgi:hypothetical protein